MAQPLSPLTDAERNSRTPSREALGKLNHGEETENFTDFTNFTIHEDPNPDPAFVTATDLLKSPTTDLLKSPTVKHMAQSNHATPSKQESHTPQRTPLSELSPREQKERSLLVEDDDNVFDLVAGPTSRPSSPADASCRDFDPDNTCLSTFSMVPNVDMTKFVRLPNSPTKSSGLREELQTPRSAHPTTHGTARPAWTPRGEASPTPRRGPPTSDDATTQLLEFTEQLNYHAAGNRNQYSPSKARHTSPAKSGRPTTPRGAGPFANLLDFDLPPAPTPRSLPSITARELESLKAGFMSEISSLRATLSGREAEVRSLVAAKDDAEQRNGRAQEELREVWDARTGLEEEKRDWEKRDKELKEILRGVKDELLHREREQEELAGKLEARERRIEEAEARATEAEGKLAGMQTAAAAASDHAHPDPASGGGEANPCTPGSDTGKAVEQAVAQVARDLHGLYKTKHEAKVAALKKSYEARWEKRVRELERNVDVLIRENEDLRVGRDATMSGVVPGALGTETAKAEHAAELQLLRDTSRAADERVEELAATADRLEADLGRLRHENGLLRVDLEASRAENGELVAAVEQMLQLEGGGSSAITTAHAPPPTPTPIPAMTPVEEPLSRPQSRTGMLPKPSGLRGPGFGGSSGLGESRIGTMKRSVSGMGRSGIMSNIERMGRGRAGE